MLRFSEHLSTVDGEALFRHASALGLEGIVSKKLMCRYKMGRLCKSWVRVQKPSFRRRRAPIRVRGCLWACAPVRVMPWDALVKAYLRNGAAAQAGLALAGRSSHCNNFPSP